jgi:hypothetical protein
MDEERGGREERRQTDRPSWRSLFLSPHVEGGREEREGARHGGGDREFSRSQGVEP